MEYDFMSLGEYFSIYEIDYCTESVRHPGIEPGSQEWESCMITLHYWRLSKLLLRSLDKGMCVTTNKQAIWQIMLHFTKDILWIHI